MKASISEVDGKGATRQGSTGVKTYTTDVHTHRAEHFHQTANDGSLGGRPTVQPITQSGDTTLAGEPVQDREVVRTRLQAAQTIEQTVGLYYSFERARVRQLKAIYRGKPAFKKTPSRPRRKVTKP